MVIAQVACLSVALAMTADAAQIVFRSDVSGKSDGIWFCDGREVPLSQSQVYNLDQKTTVKTRFTRGSELAAVCVRYESDSYSTASSGKVTIKFEMTADGDSMSVPISIDSVTSGWGDSRKIYGWAACSIGPSVNLPAGTYTVRVTASCPGYSSATTSKSFRIVDSGWSVPYALGVEDAVWDKLISFCDYGAAAWTDADLLGYGSPTHAISGWIGGNKTSILTLEAFDYTWLEFNAGKFLATEAGVSSTSGDSFSLYRNYGDYNQNRLLTFSDMYPQLRTCYAIGYPGGDLSWVYKRDGSSGGLLEERCGILSDMSATRMCAVSFNPNGGSAVDPILCVPWEAYNYVYGKMGIMPFPEDGPESSPNKNGEEYEFAGWYDSEGNLITGGSTVVKTYNHTLNAEWRKKREAQPDLIVSDLKVSRSVVHLSESVRIRCRIVNQGKGSSEKCNTWISYGSKPVKIYCPPLASGGSHFLSKAIDARNLGVGTHTISVAADGGGVVEESDESNNIEYVSVTVLKDNSPGGKIDWQFHKLNASEPDTLYLTTSEKSKKKVSTFKQGQKIYVQVNFWNPNRVRTLDPVQVKIELDDGPYQLWQWPALSGRTTCYISNGQRAPSFLQNLPPGKYTLTATLDWNNAWLETNEKNNVKSISFTIAGKPYIYSESAYVGTVGVSVSWPVTTEGSVTMTGLPPGLKYSGGAIAGNPSKAGTYSVKCVSKNKAGTVSKTIKITVNPLPSWAKGSFEGGSGESYADGCRAVFTVASTGKLSGKLYRKGTVWTMASAGYLKFDGSGESGRYAVTLTNGKKKATANLTIKRDGASSLSGFSANVPDWSFRFGGFRTMWKSGNYAEFAKSQLKGRTVTLKGEDYGLASGERIKLSFAKDGSIKAAATFVTKKSGGKKVSYAATATATVVSSKCEPYKSSGKTAWNFNGECYLYFPANKAKSFTGRLCHLVFTCAAGGVVVGL